MNGIARPRSSAPRTALATSAHVAVGDAPRITNRVPSTNDCTHAAPRSGSMNCGRNDRKNSATFGFSVAITKPWVNARRYDVRVDPLVKLLGTGEQRLDADADQVRGAQPFDDVERRGRRGEDRRQSDGGGDHVHEVAERHTATEARATERPRLTLRLTM